MVDVESVSQHCPKSKRRIKAENKDHSRPRTPARGPVRSNHLLVSVDGRKPSQQMKIRKRYAATLRPVPAHCYQTWSFRMIQTYWANLQWERRLPQYPAEDPDELLVKKEVTR